MGGRDEVEDWVVQMLPLSACLKLQTTPAKSFPVLVLGGDFRWTGNLFTNA